MSRKKLSRILDQLLVFEILLIMVTLLKVLFPLVLLYPLFFPAFDGTKKPSPF